MSRPRNPRRRVATSEASRARRFALPALADDRADGAIQAFLAGRGRTRAVAKRQHAPVPPRRLPGRLTWEEAVRREADRAARYGSHAAVAILEIRPLRPTATLDSWLRLHVSPVAEVLAREVRTTDTAARVATTRFQVLLPETDEGGAGQFVERVVNEVGERLRSLGAPLTLKAGLAVSGPDLALPDAVSRAIDQLDAA